jgi:hypothetical protein
MKNVVRAACIATAVAAVIAGQAVTATSALAITGLVRVAEDSPVNSGDKNFDVPCPGGTVVTGGGGYIVATAPSPKGKVGITGIRPQADGGGVQVIAREADVNFASNWIAAAVALCAPEPAGYEVVEQPSATDSSSTRSAVAECTNANGRVIGSGAFITGADRRVFLESAVPADDLTSVTATAHETQTGTANFWTLTAVAVCANNPAGLELSVGTTGGGASPTYDSMSRVCPGGKEMFGTGFAITGGAGQVLPHGLNVVPETTIRFAANEDANGYGSNWGMNTYALCAS